MVDDTKAVGLLDQWLIEGKYTEEEALMQSCDILSAGLDTVSIILLYRGKINLTNQPLKLILNLAIASASA